MSETDSFEESFSLALSVLSLSLSPLSESENIVMALSFDLEPLFNTPAG